MTDTDTKFDLAAVKAACEGHTPGPLKIGFSDGSGGGGVEWEGSQNDYERENGYYICDSADEVVIHGGSHEGIPIGVLKKADALLYTVAPALLAECERLQGQRDSLEVAALKVAAQRDKARGEVDKLKVPMSVTEQDYRNLMRVNKGLVDKVTTLTTKLERCRFDLQEARREGSNAMDMWKKRAKKCKAAEADRDRLRGALVVLIPEDDFIWDDETMHTATCRWCGRVYEDHDNDPVPRICPSDDCPANIARAALADTGGGDTDGR